MKDSTIRQRLKGLSIPDDLIEEIMSRAVADRVGRRYAQLHQMLREELQAQAWEEGWQAGAGWPQQDVNPYRRGNA